MAVGATKLRWSKELKKSDEKTASAGSELQLVELAFRLGQSSAGQQRQDHSGEPSQPAFPRRTEALAPKPLPLEERSMWDGFILP